jgi:putative aldouronate transport system substrate-binding protein
VNDPDYDNKYSRGEVPHIGTTRNLAKNLRNELDYDFNFDREDHELTREARDLYRNNDFIRENWIASLNFTDEERSILSPINAELDTYRGEMLDRFIMGVEPMDRWEAFTARVKGMNVDTALEIYQSALDRLLVNNR